MESMSIDHYRDPDPETEEPCCERYNPKEYPEEFCNLFSMLTVVIGMLLITVGYIYPRDYTFDPYEHARVMEAIEIYYSELSFRLDVVVIVGMGFIGIGGFIYSILFVTMMYQCAPSECCSKGSDGQDIPLCEISRPDQASGYGATSDAKDSSR